MGLQQFDWNLIQSFLAVFEDGSLSAAARRLGVSQPTLGRHVGELESALGVTLFERSREGLSPTSEAVAIAVEARHIAESANAISLAAAGRSKAVEGTVRITASEVVATYLLTGVLGRILEKWPGIEVELVPSNEVQNLLRRDADIAVRMVRPTQMDLVARQVNQVRIGLFAHPDYLARHGTPSGVEDLAGHVVIGYDRSDLIIRGLRENGIEVDRHFFRFRTDDQVCGWEAVRRGLGIGFGPLYLGVRQKDLIRIGGELPVTELPMWLVTHREIHTSARIRVIYDDLAESLASLRLNG